MGLQGVRAKRRGGTTTTTTRSKNYKTILNKM